MRHLLQEDAKRGDTVARQCFRGEDPRNEPELPLDLVERLVQWNYTTNVRELRAELWRHLAAERLGFGDAHSVDTAPSRENSWIPSRTSASMTAAPSGEPSSSAPEPSEFDSNPLTRERLQEALDRNNGVLEATWRGLGLKNRFALLRLIKRFDLEVRKRPAQSRARPPKG
jgi:transcriptional regulator with GAF, ATPase, and Fis domain